MYLSTTGLHVSVVVQTYEITYSVTPYLETFYMRSISISFYCNQSLQSKINACGRAPVIGVKTSKLVLFLKTVKQ